jgi:hypothetical protein
MINPVNNKIIVSVNLSQKDTMIINGKALSTALKFEKNYREKSPTIAKVIEGNDTLKEGDILLTHHNLFQEHSPYHLQDDLYAVPFSKVLLAKIDKDGNILPICGNLICSRIPIKSSLDLPPEYQKTEDKKYKVIDGTGTKYTTNDIVLTRPSAGYDIVYIWGGIEKRVTKVDQDQICGILVN